MTLKPPPLPPGKAAPVPQPKQFAVVSGTQVGAERVLIFGPGGIGKSSLAALAPKPVFIDLENGTRRLTVDRLSGVESFADLRAALLSLESSEYQSVVIDSATRVEELSVAHTIATVLHDKGHPVASLEGYGFGKGYSHNFDTFCLFLQDCDRLIRAGKNVVLVAHVCVTPVPNPNGEDWIRYEPRLQSPKSGKDSIRDRVHEWADHVLFVGYDVAATKDGKGVGAGTRTIYPQEMPAWRAKSRCVADPVPYTKGDGAIWNLILSK